MVQECERMIFGESRQPQAKLGKVDGQWILINTVKAALRDEPASVQHFIFIRRDRRQAVMNMPCSYQFIAKLAARFNQKSAATHRWIADPQIEKPLRCG